MIRRLVIALIGAFVLLAVEASPASAATSGSDTAEQEITWTWQGVTHTCTLLASSDFAYSSESDTTRIQAGDHVVQCEGATLFTSNGLIVTYRRVDEERSESVETQAVGAGGAALGINLVGQVAAVSAQHVWRYQCDSAASGICVTGLTTNPK